MPEQSQPRTPLPASLAIERDGELLIVRLCRPAKRNALNDPTILGLEEVFTTLPAEIKAVVLEGEGEHFSAGLDLAELADYDAVGGIAHSSMWHRVFEKIQFGRVPVVAALKARSSVVAWNWPAPPISASPSARPTMPCRRDSEGCSSAAAARCGCRA